MSAIRWLRLAVAIVLAAASIYYAAIAGLQLRRWTWEATEPIRFAGDMQRNFRYGNQAMREGYLNVYENVYASSPPGDYDIDYPPLRLLTFELWLRAAAAQGQDIEVWQPSYEFNRPLLGFNSFTEAMSALAALLIVRRWTRAGTDIVASWRTQLISWGRAALAALLIWFSPAALADAHGWASYDVWIPPFFLWSLYLASCRWWTVAGLVLGVGAMFKGQMLLVAPVFVLWPAMAGELASAVKFVCGFVIATAAVATPFICTSEAEATGQRQVHALTIFWIACVGFSALLPVMLPMVRTRPISRKAWVGICCATYGIAGWLMVWPMFRAGYGSYWWMLLSGAALVLLVASLVRRRQVPLLLITVVSASVFASMALFENSPAWWSVGFRYGTQRFYHLIQGPNANLPALLNTRYGWNTLTEIALTIAPHTIWNWPTNAIEMTSRQFLLSLYLIGMFLCSVAAAVHWRRSDRRFLVAASTVWILFYCFLPQMIGRYLLFGSTVAAIATAESVGLGLLSLVLSAVSAICTLQLMGRTYGGYTFVRATASLPQQVIGMTVRTLPGLAWAVLFIAAVFLTISMTFRRSGKMTKLPLSR